MQKIIGNLAVHTYGNKSKQPIVFIHGFPFDSWMWHKQVEQLQKNYYCITYDVRGLGDSYVGDGQYTMEAYVADLFSIIEALELKEPVLCGLSMGGYIALRAVELKQKLFRGLILCDTKSEADDDAGKLNRSVKINQINTEGLEKFIDEFMPVAFADETPKEQKKLFIETSDRAKNNNPIGVKGALIALLSRTDTTPSLSKITIPTLVISGSFDKITPPVIMRKMADQIKDSEFAIAPRAGHMSPLENPDFVNDIIEGFMKRKIK